MKKMLLMILCFVCFNLGVNSHLIVPVNQAGDQVAFIYTKQRFAKHRESLLNAFMYVESRHNPKVYNEQEKAAGVLQIRPIMLRHVNRISGSRYKLSDRFNKDKSIAMFDSLMRKRNPRYNIDTACNLWNAGMLNADIPKYKQLIYSRL